MNILKRFFPFFVLILTIHSQKIQAQNIFGGNDQERLIIVIDSVKIEGNDRTSRRLIERLIEFDPGDSIYLDRLFLSMQSSRFHLVRSKLFQEVTILLKDLQRNHANIYVLVDEKSLISLLGTVDLADRNISEWWKQHKFSLRRLTVGGGGIVSNWLGQGEYFGLYGLIGLNQGINAYFNIPYFTPNSNWGANIDYEWSRNRIFGVENEKNRLTYLETSKYSLHQISTRIGISYRPTPEIITTLAGGYHQARINEKVTSSNANFFGEHGSKQRYLSLSISFELNKTDHYRYPLNGTRLLILGENRGVGLLDEVNQQVVRIEASHYQQWIKKIYSAHRMVARLTNGEDDNFFLQRSFGYEEDFVRSHELSVIQGQHFLIARNDLKYQLLTFDYIPPSYLQWLYDKIPFDLFAKFLLDGGIVVNSNPDPDNELANEFLLGYGLGFDFVFLNEYAASISFSMNRLNQKGIYLHINW